jgi:hypothetical protein
VFCDCSVCVCVCAFGCVSTVLKWVGLVQKSAIALSLMGCLCGTLCRVIRGRTVADLPCPPARPTFAANPGHDFGQQSAPLPTPAPPAATTTTFVPSVTVTATQGDGAAASAPMSLSFNVSATAVDTGASTTPLMYSLTGSQPVNATAAATTMSVAPALAPAPASASASAQRYETAAPPRGLLHEQGYGPTPLDAALAVARTPAFTQPGYSFGLSDRIARIDTARRRHELSRRSASVGGAAAEAEAYASLLCELCEEVGVTTLTDLAPRIRQLCTAALILPVLDGFASTVCDSLGRFVGPPSGAVADVDGVSVQRRGGGDIMSVGLSEAVTMLSSILSEVRQLRGINQARRRR